jgi:hypothetical protein
MIKTQSLSSGKYHLWRMAGEVSPVRMHSSAGAVSPYVHSTGLLIGFLPANGIEPGNWQGPIQGWICRMLLELVDRSATVSDE